MLLKVVNSVIPTVGHTQDLKQRLVEHNKRKTLSNKAFKPFNLVYYEAFKTREEAILREKYFNKSSGRELLKDNLKIAPVVQLDRIPDFGSGG